MRYNKRDKRGRFVAESRVTEDEGIVERLKEQRDAEQAEADLWKSLYNTLCAHVVNYVIRRIEKRGFFARLFGRG